MNLFEAAIRRQNNLRPPVWFMRQAGRYHSHYQALRKRYSFIDLCKRPEIACEVTMGPIRDFGFDAAILFSDLLFPLEAMGMGLHYDEGPKLGWNLEKLADLSKLKGGVALIPELEFQGRAIELIRKELPAEKGLLGFVGAPLTLFCYAVEGRHQGDLRSSREGLTDGRFAGFFEKLADLLVENMLLQAQAGADAVAVFDTCAGEIDPVLYREAVVPSLRYVLNEFEKRSSGVPVIYYSKGTGPDHWKSLKGLPFACLGVDSRHEMAEVLLEWGQDWAIQGNFEQTFLFLDPAELEKKLRHFFGAIQKVPAEKRKGWICGLGHGVLPKTPEENVRLFLKIQKEFFP